MRLKNMSTIKVVLSTIGLILIVSILLSFSKSDRTVHFLNNHLPLPQEIRPVPIKTSYSFAGETLDTRQFDLKERLDRELIVNAYRHSSTIQYIKLANRYFPVIEPILKKITYRMISNTWHLLKVAFDMWFLRPAPRGSGNLWNLSLKTWVLRYTTK
jgi:hypothetical protein